MQALADLIATTERIVHLSREENARLIQSVHEMRITLTENAEQVLLTRAWLKDFEGSAQRVRLRP